MVGVLLPKDWSHVLTEINESLPVDGHCPMCGYL